MQPSPRSALQVGIIGLDTSHVETFARLLNVVHAADHIPGARIVAGYPGGSPDFEKSASRVQGFTEKLANDYNVRILNSPEEVAAVADAILITTVDGRKHLDQFSRVAPSRKPVFVDKPFALSSEQAHRMVEMARINDTPLMSCSSLRFAEGLIAALADNSQGRLEGIDLAGPMPIEPTQPGFFWYGIHQADTLFAALGPGCVDVHVTTSESDDIAVGRWRDGRLGSIRGYRNRGNFFRAVLHRKTGLEFCDLNGGGRTRHANLLRRIVAFFQSGDSPIPMTETLEVIRFLEAANESRISGSAVTL